MEGGLKRKNDAGRDRCSQKRVDGSRMITSKTDELVRELGIVGREVRMSKKGGRRS